MAGPAAAGAMKVLAKMLAALGIEPEKILQAVLILLVVPAVALAVFFIVPAAMMETVPMAQPAHVQYYVDAANMARDKYGLSLDWQELVALDAVLLEQDFSRTSRARAESLADLFVQEVIEETDGEDQEIEVSYRLLFLDEVMAKRNLDAMQQRQVAVFLSANLERLRGAGIETPPGWIPNPWGRFNWPLPDGYFAVTSVFGPRVLSGENEFHAGLDVAGPRGTPVLAADDGKVTYADWMGTAGRAIIIQHAGGYETRYYHLNSINVRAGQEVKQSDLIGTVGSTGKSTGNHLHFEVRRWGNAIDPLSFY